MSLAECQEALDFAEAAVAREAERAQQAEGEIAKLKEERAPQLAGELLKLIEANKEPEPQGKSFFASSVYELAVAYGREKHRARKAEADLASLKERLRGIANRAADALVALDSEQGEVRIDTANERLEAIRSRADELAALSTQPNQENTSQEDLAEVEGEAECQRPECGHRRDRHGPFRNSATAFCEVQTCRCFDFKPEQPNPVEAEARGEGRIAELEQALRDVRFHTGLGEARDGTIAEIRTTVDRALGDSR